MKARVALLASLVSLCLVAGVAAQVSTVEGTVVSNSGGSLVVDTGSGQRTFMVDAQSSLPTDLATGARVKVEYHTLANDKFHAFKVSSVGAATATTTTTDRTDMAGTAATRTEPTGTTRTDSTTGTTMQDRTTTTTTGTTMQDRTPTTTTDTPTTTTTTTTSDETMATGSRRELPATASPLPLMALAGGLAMAGGALVRRLRS